ncbi:cytochrome P450 [Mycena floridula]|nr:cytochrome P450 [Mycena floridula]
MTLVAQLSAFNLIALGLSTWIFSKLVQRLIRNSYATPLRGPTSSPSFLYGYQFKIVEDQNETATLYQDWATEYGSVFSIPWIMGESTRTVLMDPKAIAHFYARGEAGYTQPQVVRKAIARIFGNGIITAEGEVHRRQRKSLTPSFSPATIRGITSVFFDAAYKLKAAWDSQLDASTDDFATIEVQKWMTAVALDSIGMGGFSHDFGTLDGKQPLIATAMDGLGKGANRPPVTPMMIIMGHLTPVLLKLPIGRAKVISRLKASLTTVGTELVDRVRKEQDTEGKESGDKSVIGALIKSSSTDESMSRDEIQGQMVRSKITRIQYLTYHVFISDGSSPGYITTAVSMTWALIELAKAQDKQERLRKELLSLGPNDPTYDQLSSATALPYLDAVVHEILRLHPAISETPRRCNENDIVPLSTPITTRTGQVVSSIAIPKGALVVAPIRAMNTSETFWGPDAKEFRPERWLEGDLGLAKEIQAHHHIYTFITGPRECLGKTFALTEFKSVLSVLIRNYTFEFPDGPKTKIGDWRALLPKPNVEGQIEGRVPMIVRRVE